MPQNHEPTGISASRTTGLMSYSKECVIPGRGHSAGAGAARGGCEQRQIRALPLRRLQEQALLRRHAPRYRLA